MSTAVNDRVDTTKAHRRRVRYLNLQEVLDDAAKQASRQAGVTGNWSQGQIFEHLARTMDSSIDGFQSRVPWLFRAIGKVLLMKRKIIRKGMPPGFRLSGKAAEELVPGPTETAAGLEHLRNAVARIQHESKRQPHPFFGKMSTLEWEQLHLRHAELHMSFIV